MSTSGSIKYDEARKSWSFIVDIPGADGRRRQLRRRGFVSKKQAQAALTELLADMNRGALVPPTKVTVAGYLLDVWLPARRSSLRPSTAATYDSIIRSYILPRLGSARLQAVTGAELNRLYDHLLTEGRTETRRGLDPGLSPKSVRNVHGVLTRAFRDAVRWGHLQRNPCEAADPPRGRTPEMRAWNTEQLRVFVRHTENHRWAAVWRLMASTGMRRGEVLGLRWNDIDLVAGTITIRSTRIRYGKNTETSSPKTARGNRTIAIGGSTVAALRSWKRAQSTDRLKAGALWRGEHGLLVTNVDGSPANPESFSNLFGKLVREANLPPIRLHDLRHSYATAALADGVPVKVLSQRIGHADVGVTLHVYAHVLPGDDEEAARRADALLGES
jgi:integrase